MPEGKIDFIKCKLDSDSSLSKMLPGNSRYILNSIVHASESGNVGDIENIKGNTARAYSVGDTPPAGTNVTIGECEDKENQAIIFFVANSNGDDYIYRYNVIADTFELILQKDQPGAGDWDTTLNFNTANPIQAVVVGDNLIWTDGLNNVRQISIEKAINFTAGSGAPIYTTITERILNLIKIPPFGSPTVVYTTDSGFQKNHLRGKLFQFAYRFVYDDWGESVYSDISDPPLPQGSEYWYGEIVIDIDLNNTIEIQVLTGNEDVTRLDIIGREGTDGAWFRVVTLVKDDLSLSDNDIYTYSFYNSQSTEEISQIEAGELFSYIPDTADTLALLEDNRIILGGITEGKEKEDIAVGFYTFTEDLPDLPASEDLQRDYKLAGPTLISSGTHGNNFEWELDEAPWSYDPVAGRILKITIDSLVHTYVITTDLAGAGNFDAYISFIEEKIENDFIDGVARYYVVESPDNVLTITKDWDFEFELDIQVYATGSDTNVLKYTGFKTGAHHPFCIIYYDDARRTNGANVNDDCVVYIDFPTEQTTRKNTNYKNSIEWRVGHKPPIWAKYWQWGYAKNSSISWFVQYPIDDITLDADKKVSIIDINALNTVNDWVTGVDPWHIGYSLGAYVWEKGDRIRFLTRRPLDAGDGEIGVLLTGGSKYIDVEILGVGVTGEAGINTLITEEIDAALVGTGAGKIDDRSLAEIYRPKKTSDYTIYKTFGQIFEISGAGTSARRHDGLMQNQWAGTQDILSSTDPGAPNPIVITSTAVHGLVTGMVIYIEGHEINTNANGIWSVTVLSPTTFELNDSLGTGDGVGGETGTYKAAAVGNFPGGDVYHILRVFNIDIDTGLAGWEHPTMVESQHYSDFYDSDVYALGRPMVELDDDLRRGTKSSLLRYGGIYIPNTKINNLAKFDYDNYTTKLRVQDGTINSLDFNGEILKVFQAHKKTSIYIGKTALYKADGSRDIVTTDAVIGSVHPGIGDEGTVFPGSVVHYKTHTYFYDIYKGEVIRDAYNGMYPISNYDMKKYFSDKSKALLASGLSNVNVQAIFDEKYGFYIITFIDSVIPANNDTVAFHEDSNSWISFYSFTPEMYSSYGETMISFKNGLVWVHNENDVYCNFYGTQYTQQVDIIFNAGVENVKTFKTIAVYSNKKWSAPDSGDISISPTNLYPTGMSSRLRGPHFKDIEGVFRADFLQNELTSSGVPVAVDLLNGDDLRGSAIRINLKNSETVSVVLSAVEIGFDLSV